MAELSIKWGSFLIYDQFIDSIAREVIIEIPKIRLVPGLSVRRLTLLMGKSCCWLIVSILWTGVNLVLQVTCYPGVKLPLAPESLDLLFPK